jgi:hypothetical protein
MCVCVGIWVYCANVCVCVVCGVCFCVFYVYMRAHTFSDMKRSRGRAPPSKFKSCAPPGSTPLWAEDFGVRECIVCVCVLEFGCTVLMCVCVLCVVCVFVCSTCTCVHIRFPI